MLFYGQSKETALWQLESESVYWEEQRWEKDNTNHLLHHPKKEAEYLAAEYVLKNKTMPERKILGSLIDAYIADRENILSPTTIQGYRKIRRNNFQQLMDLPVDRIDNAILQRAINQEAMHNSPKSVANAYGLISSVLRQNTYYRYSVTLPKNRKRKRASGAGRDFFA